ncbi:hypothetical protein [Streptomyces profundus]|uniref:hypothetical protein n=1 Tax=Streptomyces profundus TaxID=2867410 RepID=UPI001D16D246|nr:hypothetical protein [Streptomyces sp. MA3_2.13]UED86161.1 hypothetical protein K4G22_19835 [Streptomyces sp. MA3_2.13]
MTETSTRAAVAAGMAAGYLLGRTKKAKLALVLASYALGRRVRLNPRELVSDGLHRLGGTDQFAKISDQVRGELLSSGRSVVSAVVHRGYETVADGLASRTKALLDGATPGGGDQPEPASERPARRPDRKRSRSGRDPDADSDSDSASDAEADTEAGAEADGASDADGEAGGERGRGARARSSGRRRPGEPLPTRERAPRRPSRRTSSAAGGSRQKGGGSS